LGSKVVPHDSKSDLPLLTQYFSIFLMCHSALTLKQYFFQPTGLSGTFWHYRAGNVHVKGAMMIGISCAAGMYVAANFLAPKLSDANLRYIFAALLVASAVKMFWCYTIINYFTPFRDCRVGLQNMRVGYFINISILISKYLSYQFDFRIKWI